MPTPYHSNAPVPRWLWPLTLSGVGAVLAITVGGVILISRGAADPPVAGPVTWSDTVLDWASGPTFDLAPGYAVWLPAPEAAFLPADAFTLTVTAHLSPDSDPGAAWGIWLDTQDGSRLLYAISGEGYTTTRACPPDWPPDAIEDCPAVRPEWRWMPYNRLNPPGDTNAIRLHVETPGAIRLRLNNERLGIAPAAWNGTWGVWVRGGRSSRAVLRWDSAERRTPDEN
ncbi:MAG: hypothetical protein JW966_04615 [Anaerolineae bacterium]|nr:hypothetical protein [Anaerolineae bacterium]